MKLERLPLQQILQQPESEWLDWKKEYASGLLAESSHPDWEKSRGKVLRALASIANTIQDQIGYLIYGVDDSTQPRRLTGTITNFDDAMFQDWNAKIFRPRIDFHYRNQVHDGARLGIFEIRPSSEYPHVCDRAVSTVLTEGQVWLRRGSRCTIALHEDLRRMFEPQTPIVVSDPDGSVVQQVRAHLASSQLELYFPAMELKEDLLANGYRLAHLPYSRREIHLNGRHILFVRNVRAG